MDQIKILFDVHAEQLLSYAVVRRGKEPPLPSCVSNNVCYRKVKLPEILHQHDVGFGELVLHIDERLAFRRDAHSPARFFVEGPQGSGLTGCKFEECDSCMREPLEPEEIDPVWGYGPVGPFVASCVAQDLAFLASLEWHSPYASLLVLAVIKEATVR